MAKKIVFYIGLAAIAVSFGMLIGFGDLRWVIGILFGAAIVVTAKVFP